MNTDIDRLVSTSTAPCISMIIPTDRTDKKKNYETVKKAVQKAKMLLRSKALPADLTKELIFKIENSTLHLSERVLDGLGIFISPSSSAVLAFPFEVKQKIIVDSTFETRDLIYLQQFSTPYYILNLSKKGVHLFKAVMNELTEIKDGNFPLLYDDQYEYERASIANASTSSLKGFERDKNQLTEIRLKAVFRDADAFIKNYLADGSNFILAGTQRMIGLFQEISGLHEHLAGKISGSYNEKNIAKLGELSWETFVRAKKGRLADTIKNLEEKKNGYLAEGLQQAWTAAKEGKGLMLMVEKDLHHRAYRKANESRLYLQPPARPYEIVPDAVDDLIETVKKKNGKVIFTENARLRSFDHLALVLRY